MQYAYCWRSGLIEFGKEVPEGALPIGQGGRAFRTGIEVNARLSRTDNKTFFVPGVAEADSADEALAALVAFTHRIESRSASKKAVAG